MLVEIRRQWNIKDIEGNFLEDYTGFVRGYDEHFVYLDNVPIPIPQIRGVIELLVKINRERS